jgi:DNA modification methylase
MILHGDALTELKKLDGGIVQTCITSPPYWGLRDYGVEKQIGLEHSPDEYISALVEIFREVKRVLRDDGTLWLNLGDSYSGSLKGSGGNDPERSCKQITNAGSYFGDQVDNARSFDSGLKPKDLCMIPARVALALQADGWYLRSDIIWSKPNPMPESVKDRPTSAHEHIFLLAKSQKYYYDAAAIAEPLKETSKEKYERALSRTLEETDNYKNRVGRGEGRPHHADGLNMIPKTYKHEGPVRVGRESMANPNRIWDSPEDLTTNIVNKRNVWTVPTQPYPDAHFAVYPPALIEPCVLAGSREGDIVLDPFFGSGTTGLVAIKHRREFIGIELNEEYIRLAEKRLREVEVVMF